MGKVKQIEIKNRTYYFYNDIINIEEFDSNLLKIDKKSYKDIDIYYIGYITITNEIPKDHEYCACLSAILLDSIFVNSNKEYYLQIFLEECKYAIKDRKIINTINEDLKLNESDDESDE